MKLKVYYLNNNRVEEGTTIYDAQSFQIEDGHLYIYANWGGPGSLTIAVYAPGFWSTIENMDEINK